MCVYIVNHDDDDACVCVHACMCVCMRGERERIILHHVYWACMDVHQVYLGRVYEKNDIVLHV